MEIKASQVKELRERSGAGMMECKRALVDNAGDIDAAMEHLRKSGMAKADKKADRVAAEGRIVMAKNGDRAVLVEINSETDFVAKDESFAAFAQGVADTALASDDVDALLASSLAGGESVENARQALVAKIGENIKVRRMVRVTDAGTVGAYVHGGRIGVIVDLEGGSEELARGIAMHVAAMNPPYLDANTVPADFVAKERDIAMAQVKDSGKPAEILEKMVAGKVKKTLAEMCLVDQPYVLDTNGTVGDALSKEKARVKQFHRLAVGEGIERKQDDFAAEVMKQAGLG